MKRQKCFIWGIRGKQPARVKLLEPTAGWFYIDKGVKDESKSSTLQDKQQALLRGKWKQQETNIIYVNGATYENAWMNEWMNSISLYDSRSCVLTLMSTYIHKNGWGCTILLECGMACAVNAEKTAYP